MIHDAMWKLLNLLVWTALVTSSQTKPPAALSEPLRTHVRDERFQIVSSIRGLPLGVREELQEMWGSDTLDIAEPGAAFQGAGATADPALPVRRLVAAGCALDQHCLVYYERGDNHTWLVALFRWTPAATRLEFGGRAPAGLKTIDEVRKAVLSGAIDRNVVW